MNNKPDELAEFGFLIYDIGRFLRSHIMVKLNKFDLTEAQWRTLVHLKRMEGCRQTELANAMQIRPITLARVIDKLETSNLVRRAPHKEDRRAFSLYLTKEAKPLLDEIQLLGTDVRKFAVKDLSDSDRHNLISMLKIVRDRLNGEQPEP